MQGDAWLKFVYDPSCLFTGTHEKVYKPQTNCFVAEGSQSPLQFVNGKLYCQFPVVDEAGHITDCTTQECTIPTGGDSCSGDNTWIEKVTNADGTCVFNHIGPSTPTACLLTLDETSTDCTTAYIDSVKRHTIDQRGHVKTDSTSMCGNSNLCIPIKAKGSQYMVLQVDENEEIVKVDWVRAHE